jgi:hypothetical protein
MGASGYARTRARLAHRNIPALGWRQVRDVRLDAVACRFAGHGEVGGVILEGRQNPKVVQCSSKRLSCSALGAGYADPFLHQVAVQPVRFLDGGIGVQLGCTTLRQSTFTFPARAARATKSDLAMVFFTRDGAAFVLHLSHPFAGPWSLPRADSS